MKQCNKISKQAYPVAQTRGTSIAPINRGLPYACNTLSNTKDTQATAIIDTATRLLLNAVISAVANETGVKKEELAHRPKRGRANITVSFAKMLYAVITHRLHISITVAAAYIGHPNHSALSKMRERAQAKIKKEAVKVVIDRVMANTLIIIEGLKSEAAKTYTDNSVLGLAPKKVDNVKALIKTLSGNGVALEAICSANNLPSQERETVYQTFREITAKETITPLQLRILDSYLPGTTELAYCIAGVGKDRFSKTCGDMVGFADAIFLDALLMGLYKRCQNQKI